MPWTTGTLILDTILRDDHKTAQTIYNLLLATFREKRASRHLPPVDRLASYIARSAQTSKGEATTIERSTSSEASDIAAARGTNVIGRRVFACLLDCTLVTGLSLVAFAPLLFVRPRLVVVLLLLLLFALVFCVFYLAYVVAVDGFRGRTSYKMLYRISAI